MLQVNCLMKHQPLSSVDKGSIRVDKIMEKANIAYAEALKKLDKIRVKQKKIGTTVHKLLIYSRSYFTLKLLLYLILIT